MRSAATPRVSRYAIRKLAREIAARFEPQCIILFGSHATGKADAESDVDLLVVMETPNQISQAVNIRLETEHPFPLDLLVRTPANLRKRLEAGDDFFREVVTEGKVLYGQIDPGRDSKGRVRLGRRRHARVGRTAQS